MFREAAPTLKGYYTVRAAITDESVPGVCAAYSKRVDLRSRIVIAGPMGGATRRARVVWRRDGAAGLAMLSET